MSRELLSNDWRAVVFGSSQLGIRDELGDCERRTSGGGFNRWGGGGGRTCELDESGVKIAELEEGGRVGGGGGEGFGGDRGRSNF